MRALDEGALVPTKLVVSQWRLAHTVACRAGGIEIAPKLTSGPNPATWSQIATYLSERGQKSANFDRGRPTIRPKPADVHQARLLLDGIRCNAPDRVEPDCCQRVPQIDYVHKSLQFRTKLVRIRPIRIYFVRCSISADAGPMQHSGPPRLLKRRFFRIDGSRLRPRTACLELAPQTHPTPSLGPPSCRRCGWCASSASPALSASCA